MSWFFVDDGLYDHPKLALLPPKLATACVGLWTLAGTWSRRKLTGGEVPRGQVARLGGSQREAAALVAAGLWEDTSDGYRFHDWALWQETPEEVEHNRQKGKERAQRWRDKRSARNAVANGERDANERRSNAPGSPSVPGEGSPSPSPSPNSASREGERARARDPSPKPVDRPELEAGEPDPAFADTVKLRTLIRIRFNQAYEKKRVNPPSWPKQNVDQINALAAWLEPLGQSARDYELLLARMLGNFFGDDRMESKGFPVSFLAADAEKFLNPPRPSTPVKAGTSFAGPAPLAAFSNKEVPVEEVFGAHTTREASNG